MASATAQGPPDAGAQADLSSLSGTHASLGLARERMNLITAGLPLFRVQELLLFALHMMVNGECLRRGE